MAKIVLPKPGPERVRPELWPVSALPVRELISVNTGNIILVDGDYDGEYFAGFQWREILSSTSGGNYPCRRNGNRETIYLARVVAGPMPPHTVAYSINGNHLDCRSANIRFRSWAQNAAARPLGTIMGNGKVGGLGIKGDNPTGYLGVRSYPLAGGKKIYFAMVKGFSNAGYYFDTAEAAARQYDEWAIARWGKHATLNFPREHLDI